DGHGLFGGGLSEGDTTIEERDGEEGAEAHLGGPLVAGCCFAYVSRGDSAATDGAWGLGLGEQATCRGPRAVWAMGRGPRGNDATAQLRRTAADGTVEPCVRHSRCCSRLRSQRRPARRA